MDTIGEIWILMIPGYYRNIVNALGYDNSIVVMF